MRKLSILSLLFLLICSTLVYGLEPLKVAYYTTNTAAQNVYVELKDYSNNSTLFIGETFNLTPNDNGIVLVNLQDHGGANGSWSNVDANNINTFYTLDIYVNGSLFAQFRLDQLMISQSNASVFDNSGNFAPPTATSSLGTDPNRWEDAYVGGNTLHIGPNSGDINDTEMKLSYNAGTGIINVDDIDVVSASVTDVSVNNDLNVGNDIKLTNISGTISNSVGTSLLVDDDITLLNGRDLIFDLSTSVIANSASNVVIQDNLDINGNVTSTSLTGAGERVVTSNATGQLAATISLPTGDLVGTTDNQTLTNKSIDADNNTITNIENADIKANAAIDATKLADGSVTSTELQYINSVTSNVQTQLDGKQEVITAGNGLSFATNTLNVGGSSTIISNATNLEVNSSATGNQVLLSSGTVGTAPTYGALPLGNSNSISGTLPVANGGTGATTLASGNFLQGNGTGAVTATKAIPTGDVVGTTDTQTLTGKSIDADNNTITNIDNADIKANAGINATKLADGSVSNTELQQLGSITSAVVGITDSQTLTNKSIDADNNTITNIENADIKANAGIDATKLADGSVSSTELQYINTVTSNVQTQLDGKQSNLPSQTGNSGRYLTTDGSNLSWGTVSGGSGGSGTTYETQNMTGSFTPLTTSYQQMPGISFSLEANTVYQLRGEFQEQENGGTSGKFDIRFPYDGTFNLVHFERLVSGGVYNESTPIENLNCDADNSGTNLSIIDGMIITNTAGTLTLEFRKNASSPNDVNINSGGNITLVKLGSSTSSGGGSGSSEVYTEVNSNTTITTDDQVVYISGNYTVTLPDPPATGQTIKFISDDVNATLDPQTKVIRDRGTDYPGTSDLFDFGGANQYQLTLYYNGTKWLPISK